MNQNKDLSQIVTDYKERRTELDRMIRINAKTEKGDELILKYLHPFFKKYVKLLATNPEQLEQISPLSAGTFQRLLTGGNTELYSLVMGINIIFYVKGYEFLLGNKYDALHGANNRKSHIILKEIKISELCNYKESGHLYIPITIGKASPLYPDIQLTASKRIAMKNYSKKIAAATMHKYLGPYAVKCHEMAKKKVTQLEEIDGHNHTTLTNLHQGRNIQMNNYFSIFDSYYQEIGRVLSYPNLSTAILKATKNGTCVVMVEVLFEDLGNYQEKDFLYSYMPGCDPEL